MIRGVAPPLCDVINRYLAKAFIAAQHDPVVNDQIARVQNLLALPPSLLTPRMQLRVRRFARRGPVGAVRVEPTARAVREERAA